MIRPERATVLERPDDRLPIVVSPPETLLALEIWGDQAVVEHRLGAALPPSCRSATSGSRRLLWWEPGIWILRTTVEDRAALEPLLAPAVGDEGAVTDLSGGFIRIRISGRHWRDLLMIGGVFDAESPSFGPGSIAGTVIHHMPVRLDVVSEGAVDAYVPPSYADDLLDHWRRSAARILAAGALQAG
jgi:heterotetrameric sarcosine oxidase gamma subunit